jgi:hypothetical protein
MNWATWERATRDGRGPQPGLRALWSWLDTNYPGIYRFGGIYVYRPVRGGTSLSLHAEGRALDAMIRPVNGRGDRRGYDAIERIGRHGLRLGIQTVIFDRTIWSRKSPDGRRYTGQNPHYDHSHWECDRRAAATLTVEEITRVVGGELPKPVRRTLRLTAPLMRGADVAQAQAALGRVTIDGVFGPATRARTIAFQRASGLDPDGIIGRKTWAALGL